MRDIPLSVVFTFPLPNYANPETRGSALLIVNAVLISIVTVIVALRLFTRIYLKRQFGLDDVFIVPAYLFTVGLTAAVILANVRYGWNRHVWDVPYWLVPAAGKIAFTAKLMFTFAATFTRISLMCFYYRLAGPAGLTRFSWAIHASQAFNLCVCVAFVALVIWQCDPIKAYWVFPPLPGRKCMNEGTLTLGCGVINCFADFLTTLLPIPLIARLSMPLRQRLGVLFLLSLGFIVTIAGCIRTYFIWKSLVDSYDQTWFSYPLWISAAVEIDLAVVCACAPALRPLARTVLARAVRRRLSDSAGSITTRLNETWFFRHGARGSEDDDDSDGRGGNPHRFKSHPSTVAASARDSRKSSAKSSSGEKRGRRGSRRSTAASGGSFVVMRQHSFEISSFVLPDPPPIPPAPAPNTRTTGAESGTQGTGGIEVACPPEEFGTDCVAASNSRDLERGQG